VEAGVSGRGGAISPHDGNLASAYTGRAAMPIAALLLLMLLGKRTPPDKLHQRSKQAQFPAAMFLGRIESLTQTPCSEQKRRSK